MKMPKTANKPPVVLPGGKVLDFSGPALVMAIVNCNEDSFYAPSRALGDKAVEKALAAEADGASIVDFGAESSRPGSSYIDEEEELQRLIPVIKAFRKRSSLPVSVDTRKALVAGQALDAGADIINDISGLGDDKEMAALCAERGAAVVLMHKRGIPPSMQEDPRYDDLVAQLRAWFASAVEHALAAGICEDKIILDPGIGFGKSVEDNFEIIRRINCFSRLAKTHGKDYPLMAGLSRKSFLGKISSDSLAGTLAANAAAVMGGADIIRVHDVKEHTELVKVLFALRAGY